MGSEKAVRLRQLDEARVKKRIVLALACKTLAKMPLTSYTVLSASEPGIQGRLTRNSC